MGEGNADNPGPKKGIMNHLPVHQLRSPTIDHGSPGELKIIKTETGTEIKGAFEVEIEDEQGFHIGDTSGLSPMPEHTLSDKRPLSTDTDLPPELVDPDDTSDE